MTVTYSRGKADAKIATTGGWQCPICGAVWIFGVRGCEICNGYAEERARVKNTCITNTTDEYTINKEDMTDTQAILEFRYEKN